MVKPAEVKQRGQPRRFDPRVHVGRSPRPSPHRRRASPIEARQAVAAGKGAEEEGILLQREADCQQRLRQVAGGIELARPQRRGRSCRARAEMSASASTTVTECRAPQQAIAPLGIEAADQQRRAKPPLDKREPLQDVLERTLVQEQLGTAPERPRAAQSHVASGRTDRLSRGACAAADERRQGAGEGWPFLPGCVEGGAGLRASAALRGLRPIVDEVHSFCPDCWAKVEFLGESGCTTCGMPLEATDAEECGACIARPPRIQRTRSAVAYDELSRSIAIRLKYGRKVALARTMARYMAPLVRSDDEKILVPVPLHRRRLWNRGFNQSALVAQRADALDWLPVRAVPPSAGSRARRR